MKQNSFKRLCVLTGLFIFLSVTLQACRWSVSDDDNTRMPASDNYHTQANVSSCDAGETSLLARQKALEVFNDIRRLHGLSPLSYDYQSDPMLMESALIMVANRQLDHYPSQQWRCYSELGKQGAGHSNIGLYQTPDTSVDGILGYEKQVVEDNVVGYMTEIYHVEKGNVGHRLWMLNPFLSQTAYGQASAIVDGYFVSSSALRVVYEFEKLEGFVAQLSTPDQIIAYPYGDYPAKYFAKGAELSFSVLIDAEDYINNYFVDYSEATITLRDETAKSWQIHNDHIQYASVSKQFEFVGLPNHIQFSYSHLQYNHAYQVTIDNVQTCQSLSWQVKGEYQIPVCAIWQSQSFSYPFKIID